MINISNDDLFMLAVDKELTTVKTLAQHLGYTTKELYRHILVVYPTLMAEVNHTLFMDSDWWKGEYLLGDDEVIKHFKYRTYVTNKGNVLRKLVKVVCGKEFTCYKERKLTIKGGYMPILPYDNTSITLSRVVATLFMDGYDTSKVVQRYDTNKGFDVDNLYQ